MIKLRTISMQNFLSIGNQLQTVNLEQSGLTLVLGENLDTTGDPNSARNGAGKTCILNAISYALFGWPLTPIKKDNLVNKSNGKNMLVVLTFEKDGIQYRIERGRKPTFTKWFVGDKEQSVPDNDEAQGDSKWTNAEILKVLGFSRSLFNNIIALNTYTVPFLNLPAKDQREIIEELLGITILSQKAESLKVALNGDKANDIKGTKDKIAEEEARIKALEESNKRIEKMIKDFESRSALWEREKKKRIEKIETSLEELSHIDIDKEIKNHAIKKKYNEITDQIQLYDKEVKAIGDMQKKSQAWEEKRNSDLKKLSETLTELNKINISKELELHQVLAHRAEMLNELKAYEKDLKQAQKHYKTSSQTLTKLEHDLLHTEDKTCPTCGQHVHDNKLDDIKETLVESINKTKKESQEYQEVITQCKNKIEELNEKIQQTENVQTFYKDIQDAYNHKSSIAQIEKEIERLQKESNPYLHTITEMQENKSYTEEEVAQLVKELESIGKCPKTHYNTIEEAYEHRSTLENLRHNLEREQSSINPYIENIKQTKEEGLKEIDRTYLNELYYLKEHQETLLKLLTDKNSFIRKKIIDQNLQFLNHRLSYYINKLGLPHEVKFLNDLSVEILNLGQEYDAGNLSRGENNRLILGLSWAFRDVWESMNTPINIMFVDELIDSGMDGQGVEAALEVLKHDTRNRGKDVFLISHREELHSRVSNVMLVQKENGFTNIITDYDVGE